MYILFCVTENNLSSNYDNSYTSYSLQNIEGQKRQRQSIRHQGNNKGLLD